MTSECEEEEIEPEAKKTNRASESKPLLLEHSAKIKRLVKRLHIDKNPKTLTVLLFMREMEKYREQDPKFYEPILSVAF